MIELQTEPEDNPTLVYDVYNVQGSMYFPPDRDPNTELYSLRTSTSQ